MIRTLLMEVWCYLQHKYIFFLEGGRFREDLPYRLLELEMLSHQQLLPKSKAFCIDQTCIYWFSHLSVDILFVVAKKLATSHIAFRIVD